MKSIAILIYMVLFTEPASVSTEKWIIEKNSNLYIEGKSNVNTFRCDVVQYLNKDTVIFHRDQLQDQKPIKVQGGLSIDVKLFDCHQKYITADLKKTIRATEHRYMKINLLTFGPIKSNIVGQLIKGTVEIQLAGITRKMEIEYTVLQNRTGVLHLAGSKKILFSHFKLSPPSKLAGLIKVEEEIKVWFQLVLRQL